ncbi:DUF2490 domain-containing protein [Muricauda sp. 81s02]|uniref:DUF2490 domain-containing protein n=2 Tax=Flagellimonas okinawensis TaxID=3031324 RepID=A0ABT5XMW6_9FLAO|nr:DUF2490 domain-containing protein [[Muricauda] okinawensis]
MSSTKWLFILLLFLSMALVQGQENLTGYWQPQFAINYHVAGSYSHNFSIANRNYIFADEEFTLKGRQLDVAHFSQLKIRDNQSIALGIQYRFRNNFENRENELRITQQYNFTNKPFAVRYGHRFRTEQRITKSLTTHRFRYRFAMDFPLMGEKLDPGEPYFVGSIENLLSVAKQNVPQYDTRLSGQIGWQLYGGFKFQMGIEYRMEYFTSNFPQNILFLLTSAQLSL